MILFWLFQLQLADNELQNVLERANGRMTSPDHCGPHPADSPVSLGPDQPKARDGKKRTDGHTGHTYLETGENYYLCSGKTVSEVSKIHTFLIFIFKTVFNKNY